MRYSVVHPIAQYKPQQFDLYAHSEPIDLFPKIGLSSNTVTGRSGVAPIITKRADNYIASLLPKLKSTSETTTQTDSGNFATEPQPFMTVDMLVDLPQESERMYPAIEPVEDSQIVDQDMEPASVVPSNVVPPQVQNDLERFARQGYTGSTADGVNNIVGRSNFFNTMRDVAYTAAGLTNIATMVTNRILGTAQTLVDTQGLTYAQALRAIVAPLGPNVQNYVGNAFLNLRYGATSAVQPLVSRVVDIANPLASSTLQELLNDIIADVQTAGLTAASVSLLPQFAQMAESQVVSRGAGVLLTTILNLLLLFNPGSRTQSARQIEAAARGGGIYGLRPNPRPRIRYGS